MTARGWRWRRADDAGRDDEAEREMARMLLALDEREYTPARSPRLALGVAALATAAVAPVAGALAWSRWGVRHDVSLPPAIDAEQRYFQSASGRVVYYADDSGPDRPLLLVHDARVGASAYEMRPLFEYFRGRRPVYALDLPGFGRSERLKRLYTPDAFAEAILDALRALNGARGGGADVVALGVGGELAARAAVERPELVHSLALLSPTGMASRMEGGQRGHQLYRVIASPLWAQTVFDLLASRLGLSLALAPRFNHAADAGLLEYAHASAHSPGARYASLYAVSGRLRTSNAIDRLYMRVTRPGLVIYDRDPYARFDALPQLLGERANWRGVRIAPTRGAPQFDRLAETAGALAAFWSAAVGAHP